MFKNGKNYVNKMVEQPVGEMTDEQLREIARSLGDFHCDTLRQSWKTSVMFARAILASAPVQPERKQLTQPDKQRLWNDAMYNNRQSTTDAAMEFGTLVESAHGIKDKND